MNARCALAGAALALASLAHAASPAAAADAACLERAARPADRQGFIAAVARNAPAVVNVTVIRERGDGFEDLDGMEFFLSSASGLPLPGSTASERAISSGFIIASDGYILTSAHAVLRAREAWVRMVDEARFPARVVGMDRRADVALLKIEATGLPVAALAAGTRLCAGEWVAAIGAPFGFEHSVTVGVVSAYPRFVPGAGGLPLIQTDAAINPGSSGGPLFNDSGIVVGMNSMIFSALGGSVGLSFALPIDQVLRIAANLRASEGAPRVEIGIRTQPVTADLARAFGLERARGALVARVDPGSPAAAAGLRIGDIVLSVNDGAFDTQPEIEEAVSSARAGTPLHLELWRRKALRRATVVAQRAKAPEPAQALPVAAEVRLGLELAERKAVAGMPAGVYVESARGSALLAGIESGDRITAVNDIDVASPADVDAALQRAGAGAVAVLVVRSGAAVYVPVLRPGR